MDPLVFLILAGLLAIPLVAVAALVLSIRNGNRNTEFDRELCDLKRDVARLREQVHRAGPPSPGSEAKPDPAPESGAGTRTQPPPVPERKRAPDRPAAGTGPQEAPPPVPSPSPAGTFASLIAPLRRANILPPSARERGEAGLGAWWTTRMGAVMAIISAVFFGVYIAQDTPSWLRWITLFAVACGVCGLGAWLERRREDVAAFGRVVFAGGLALLYFCAFAAYAVSPVRIVTTPIAGGALQTIAVGIILAASLLRQREGVAVMAILLGYVSCVFAFAGDLTNFALFGTGLLAVTAATISLSTKWLHPLAVALAGTWTVTALAVIAMWIPGTEDVSFRFGMSVLGGGLVFFILTETLAARTGGGFRGKAAPLYHYTNGTAALGLGWLFTWQLYPGSLEIFYLLFAILMLGASEEFRRRKNPVAPAAGFFVKGSALAALFLVAYFTGEVRWLGILAQAGCVLAVLRTRRELALELVFYGAIAVALGFFFYDILAPNASADVNRILGALFLFLLGGVLAIRRRFIAADTADRDPATVLALLAQLALGAAVIAYAHLLFEPVRAIQGSLGLAVLLGAMEFIIPSKRRWFAASAMAFIYAQGIFTFGWPGEAGTGATIAAGAGLVVAGFGAAAAIATIWKQADREARVVEILLHGLWLLSATLILFRTVPEPLFPLAAMLAVWAVLGVAPALRLRLLAFASALPFPYGLTLLLTDWPPAFSPAALWAAALLGIGYMFAMGGAIKPIGSLLDDSGIHRETADFAGALLACMAVFVAVRETVFFEGIPISLALGGLGLGAAWRWRPSLSWAAFSVAMIVLSLLGAYGRTVYFEVYGLSGDRLPEIVFLFTAVLPAAATVALALTTLPYARGLNGIRTRLAWTSAGAAALLLIFIAAALPVFELTAFATAVWGGAAILVFALGLFFRVRPFRMLALTGLGLCVIRLFAYDVQDAFHRVVAFAALGIVFLGIGFLYHRYRDRIEEIAS